ncbi:hypothetical protein [Burkholderia gladioli]|uniref:hypothetical protein n=1 Tax=Burkholderia gladioli TaxID=28095 RepID=UPI001C5EA4A8|nr:hypothetical protein [Burkholderia gladioli]MBW5287207.1 hypothetical protein [Burkholderia gladioli]
MVDPVGVRHRPAAGAGLVPEGVALEVERGAVAARLVHGALAQRCRARQPGLEVGLGVPPTLLPGVPLLPGRDDPVGQLGDIARLRHVVKEAQAERRIAFGHRADGVHGVVDGPVVLRMKGAIEIVAHDQAGPHKGRAAGLGAEREAGLLAFRVARLIGRPQRRERAHVAAGRHQVFAGERVVPAGLARVGPSRDRHHHGRERRRRPGAALGRVIDVGGQRVVDLQAITDHAPGEGRRPGLRLGLAWHRRARAPEVVDRETARGVALDPNGKSLHHRERAVWAIRLPAWRRRRRGAIDRRGGIQMKLGHRSSSVSVSRWGVGRPARGPGAAHRWARRALASEAQSRLGR